MLFKDLSPLVRSPSEIAYAQYNDIKPIIPNNPYEKSEQQLINEYNSSTSTPQLVFLGLDENEAGGLHYKNYIGAPRFAVDITPRDSYADQAKAAIADLEKRGLTFLEGMKAMNFSADVAAIYAMGKAFLDWNARNPYCGSCGQPTLSVNAGAKRVCPPTDFSFLPGTIGSTTSVTPHSPQERPPCSTRTTLSNLTFPRTDPTIIVAVLSSDSKRLLLGRGKKWPPYWYSTLAGFVEPAESVEDAVRREVWEESGVVLSRVVIHSTQPWPYPANLMIGAIAQVASAEDEQIKLDNDPELEDAKWFELEEVVEALRVGTSGLDEHAHEGYKDGNLRLPPRTAIANQLITAVVEGGFLAGVTPVKI